MVPELTMHTLALDFDEDFEGPPQLLSPEVSPRVGIPDDVDVHDPVLNVRIKMQSRELEMTEGLANYAVKRKAILCNDNHPMDSKTGAKSGCTLGTVCNQIHVRPGVLQGYRDAAIKNGAEPKGFIKVVHAVDPVTKKKVGVKFGHTEDTLGRDQYRQLAVVTGSDDEEKVMPEYCSSYLSPKGCTRRRRCPNIHVKHEQWRKQGCCNHHLAIPVTMPWERELVVGGSPVPSDRVIVTKGLRALAKASSGQVTVQTTSLCKYHIDGYCKMNVNCDGVHLCRGLNLDDLGSPVPVKAPLPMLFSQTGVLLPKECLEPTAGLACYHGHPVPAQVNVCPNHLSAKGCRNKVDCHLIHVNPLWYSAQLTGALTQPQAWAPLPHVL